MTFQFRPRHRALVPLWLGKRALQRAWHALTGAHERPNPFGQQIVCQCGWVRPGRYGR